MSGPGSPEATGSSTAGLSSGARSTAGRTVLIVVWMSLAAQAYLRGAGDDVRRFFGYGALLVAFLAVSVPRHSLLVRARVPVAVGGGAVAGVLALSASSGPDTVLFDGAVAVVALLIAQGQWRVGGVTGVALVGAQGAVLMSSGPGVSAQSELVLPGLMLAAGSAWHVLSQRLRDRESEHRSETARAQLAIDVGREVMEQLQAEMAEVRRAALPLLAGLAAGEPIDEVTRHELSVVEAGLRDRFQAPSLCHPWLTPVLEELRRTGTTVMLLGEPEDRTLIPDPLAARLRSLLGAAPQRSVTVRSLPAGRVGCIAVRLQGPDETTRLVLDEAGQTMAAGGQPNAARPASEAGGPPKP